MHDAAHRCFLQQVSERRRSVVTSRTRPRSVTTGLEVIRRKRMARLSAGAKVGKASRAVVGTVTGTVGSAVSGASDAVAPVAGGTARELRKLENQLAKARKLETKRFSQLAAAERSKSGKAIERRL